MMKGILHSLGYRTIDFAHHGELALQRCQQQRYQIVFIDYNLGTGKNGRQLLKDLRQFGLLDADSICMLVTGENTVPMVISAVELEPDDYLMKPFSQSVLRSRLQRIQQKKHCLYGVYQAMIMQDWLTVEVQARHLLEQYPRYAPYLRRIQVQAMLHTGKFDAAKTELAPILSQRRPHWALLQQARLEMESDQHQRCQALCEEALSTNKYLVEAYDLQSENLMRGGDPDQARQLLKKALEISPYQLQRLQQFFQLSLRTGRQNDMLQAERQMYELTRRAGSNDPKQLLNYVRCLLNAVSASTEASQKNRLQQESLLIMHRAHRDEHLLRKMDYECFERLCMARLDADPIALSLWYQQQIEPQRLAFRQFSRQGLRCYEEADFVGAAKYYEQALLWATHNSSTQLNLLQSVLQCISHNMPTVSVTPAEIIRRIQLQPLIGAQQERLQMLQRQYGDLTASSKLAG